MLLHAATHLNMKPFLSVLLLVFAASMSCAAEETSALIEPEMVRIEPGSFVMGSINGDSDERPVHRVDIGYPFELSKTEITRDQWTAVTGETVDDDNCGGNCPVQNISWDDAVYFILMLNYRTGKHYRLPSEAEWEYTCRAGTQGDYCGGSENEKLVWRDGGGIQIVSVASRKPNAWGVYDMSGNVWEWTQDCWHDNYEGAPANGSAREERHCSRRVLRGGYWKHDPDLVRAANRSDGGVGARINGVGFRLARTLR